MYICKNVVEMTMKRPSYYKDSQETQLFAELRKRVNARMESIPKSRDTSIKIKAVVLPILYFGTYFLAQYFAQNAWLYSACYAFMGISIVLIYLNLIHEAAHNNIYESKFWNKTVLSLFDLVGANSFIWQKRHVVSHHAYPNVDGWDTDIEQSGIIKIYPHGKAEGIQKHQHKFFLFIYPLYLFNWMLIRDFRDFFDKKRIIQKTHSNIPTIEKIKLIAFKLFYISYQILLPIFFFQVSWKLAIGAWFLQVIVASIFALFVLLPLHPLPENEFPIPDSNGHLPFSWLRHQLEVTNDLSNSNWFIRYVLGNFNYHVAHHLFPNISYAYYDEITDEVRKFSQEHNLNYKQFPLLEALKKHYNLLQSNAKSAMYFFEE